ncbi:MAG: TlpA family protein disulfide reductase [Bacteroidales bacterium]|nr:TlpA family protein disulfide reductase [Bacteroidales bacterium]
MKQLMYLATAVALLAACSPKAGNTTKVVGKFGEDAPEFVEISMGEALDTTIYVQDGRFEAVIPTNLTTMAVIDAGSEPIAFIADGSTITVDPDAGTAVSSNKKGPNARFAAYNEWMEKFMADYREKMNGFGSDEEAAEAYYNEVVAQFNDYQVQTVKANPDNILALLALSQMDMEDTGVLSGLLDGLSDEMKALPEITALRTAFESKAKTAEGTRFVDFTVVEDPENPETSTVKFSDYIGQGKYMLVDFWASWCGPCKAEMPNLINVYETYHSDKFDMLSVAVWDELENTKVAAEELGIVWNQIVNAGQVPTDLYGIEGIPHIILFGPDGTILKRGIRGEKIGEAVKEALGL